MTNPFPKVLLALAVIGFCATIATADVIPVGLLTFDAGTSSALAAFDITNLTGPNAVPPDYPVTTQLAISVTNLVADLQGGGTLTIDGSAFSVVDPGGDVDCTVSGDAGRGGCDFSAYNLLSATLTGTLSPITGLAGLPAGDTGIEGLFTTTITPGCGAPTLDAGCDSAVINATAVPEPATWTSLGVVMVGLLAGYKFKRSMK